MAGTQGHEGPSYNIHSRTAAVAGGARVISSGWGCVQFDWAAGAEVGRTGDWGDWRPGVGNAALRRHRQAHMVVGEIEFTRGRYRGCVKRAAGRGLLCIPASCTCFPPTVCSRAFPHGGTPGSRWMQPRVMDAADGRNHLQHSSPEHTGTTDTGGLLVCVGRPATQPGCSRPAGLAACRTRTLLPLDHGPAAAAPPGTCRLLLPHCKASEPCRTPPVVLPNRCTDVPDNWIVYPWDALDIADHQQRADERIAAGRQQQTNGAAVGTLLGAVRRVAERCLSCTRDEGGSG